MDKEKELLTEITQIKHIDNVVCNLSSLLYTAYETGLIDIKFHDIETIQMIYSLVKIAEKYEGNLPERLRM